MAFENSLPALMEEKRDLADKQQQLRTYLESAIAKRLSHRQYDLLRMQAVAMADYHCALNLRMYALSVDTKEPQ